MNICLDFDGVMNTYEGWKGEDELFEPSIGLENFLKSCTASGHKFSVSSTRDSSKILEWLIKYNLKQYIHTVSAVKPVAHLYIDDRGVRFNGDWASILNLMENFELSKAWWEK